MQRLQTFSGNNLFRGSLDKRIFLQTKKKITSSSENLTKKAGESWIKRKWKLSGKVGENRESGKVGDNWESGRVGENRESGNEAAE